MNKKKQNRIAIQVVGWRPWRPTQSWASATRAQLFCTR